MKSKEKPMKAIFSIVTWTGKAATFLLGLALALTLALAVAAGTAEAAKTQSLKAGVQNAVKATTSVVGSVAGPILRLDNNGAGPALDLQVESGNAPMKVNSDAKVANLNVDKVDGQDADALEPLVASVNQTSGNLDTSANNRGAESARKTNTGVYEVTFDRDISRCPRVATLGASLGSRANPDIVLGLGQEGEVNTFNTLNNNKVGVFTGNSAGTRTDRPFQVAVFC